MFIFVRNAIIRAILTIIIAIIVGGIAVLVAVFFLLRKMFYRLVDKRIAEFQSDLIAKQTAEIIQNRVSILVSEQS